ncbi:hypothetical protein KKA47_03820, partial [bacterium]|nr:hypothetical protein [bacterium]
MIIAIGLLSLVPSLRPAFAIEEQKPYNVEFRDANIKSAIRLLAKIDGRNVVVPTSVDGQVTASFQGVNVEDALQAVLKTNGYGMILENNIFQVFPQKDMASLGEDLLTSAYDLKYAKAQDILPHVESLLTERGSAIADERTNAVHIRDTKAAVDNIVELIDKL